MRNRSDAQLVTLARSGDRGAFGELVRRYQRPAYSVALAVAKSPADAEDVVQESFMVALAKLERCRNPARFGGWFLTIVRNRAKNWIRRESLRSAGPIPEHARASGPSPEKAAHVAELRERLTEALDTLTEVQREVVLLHDLEGWKHAEIARRLEMPTGTVRSHLHFARKALRARLSGGKDLGKAG